ncbi:MAG: DNA polymerase III subunit gamma/tau, partial [Xanthomonas euvesicatoria]|nr:DNA polymerase III subunit gamma/tau [Xanthomonas euvesicatoria]
VKFLLATTDPQKLPVTVLSRCLQFNLKRLDEDQIQGQMTRILAAEQIESDPSAIVQLSKAADGSLRDGLSLLDQAIAYA